MAVTVITETSLGTGGANTQTAGMSLNMSGTGQCSGVSAVGCVSGPWYIEEQRLSFAYKRVPNFGFDFGSINLSAMNATLVTTSTELLLKVYTVQYTVRKEYDWYSTSTYTQPQRFTVFAASADEIGTTYGTLAAGALGCAGEVQTTQPWYFRRLWDDGVDQEIDVRLIDMTTGADYPGNAYNYYGLNNYDCSWGTDGSIDTPELGELMFWKNVAGFTMHQKFKAMHGGSFNAVHCGLDVPKNLDATLVRSSIEGTLGGKMGAYDAAQDTANDVQPLVDTVGVMLSETPLGGGTPSSLKGWISTPENNPVRNIHYEISRHYWGA